MAISKIETNRLILRKFEEKDIQALYLLLKDEERLEYVVQETVGLGVIDDILTKHPLVTDISYNATDLTIETPEEKFVYNGEVEEDYIIKIIQKYKHKP